MKSHLRFLREWIDVIQVAVLFSNSASIISLFVLKDMIKVHFHTNEPWKLLEYCNSVGEIYDIVVEDMIRQSNGKQG